MSSFAPRRTVSLVLLTLVLLLSVLTLSLGTGSASADSRVRDASASVGDRRARQPDDKRPNKPDTLDTSNQYGVAGATDLNQAGDYAFIGNGQSGLFFRPNGGSIRRAIQMGEPIPGIANSRTDLISTLRINSSGKLAFLVQQFNTPDGFSQAAILTYQGTTLQKIVSAADIAPGTAGAIYGRNIALAGINNAGDIAFTGSLLPLGSLATVPVQTTLFIIPNGGASIRIAGPGDAAPGTGGGTFTGITLASGTSSLNNAGEVLFRAQVVGGNGGFGMFAGSSGGVRKIVSHGDAIPGGGTFSFSGSAPTGILNNVGQCVFTNGTYWIQAIATGITRAVGSGDAAPVALGGTLTLQTLAAINDAGTIAFAANVNGSGVTPRGLFRFVPGTGVETVAFANQAATGAAPAILSTFQAVSINQTGQVSFQAVMTGGTIARGIFLQSGAGTPVNVALEGQPSPVPGGGIFLLVTSSFTKTLDNGATYFWSDVINGPADYAEYVGTSGALTTLMYNADTLPAGAKVNLRNFNTQAAGDFVAFNAQQGGGKFSIVVRNVNSNITTTPVIAGDVAPGTGGARLRAAGGFFVNSVGSIAFSSATVGGNQALASGIFVWTQGGSVAKLVQTNDVDPNSGGNFSAPSFGTFAPSALNDANQVAFKSTVLGKVGIFVGSAGGAIQRLVQTGDNAPGGGTFSNLPNALAINQSGQVAFMATTTAGPGQNQGIFVGTPGGAVAKIAVSGDAVPGGGTFFGFPGSVSFNDSGEVAFIASLDSGTTGAVCVGTTAGALQVLARDGAASPAGGNFAITGTGVDVLINNQHDVAFRSTLSGGSSDSAYFVRRGAGPVQVVARQGQAAPGTTGTFVTISPSLNNFLGEFFALGPTGEVAINGTFQTVAGNIVGAFRYRTDNLLEKVIVRGDVVPGTGNGILLVTSQAFGTGGPGRFAFWEAITGGSVEDQIFVTTTPSGFGISGQVKDLSGVGIAGVQISLSGTVSGATTTDVASDFSFLNLVNGGSYTITPASSIFSFSPANQTFNNLSVDNIANFVGTQTAFNITGKVVDGSNAPINNATVALTKNGVAAGTVQTNASGDYTFANQTAGANYVVTPAGTFTPSSQTLNNLTANAAANFKAAPSIPPQCSTVNFAAATSFATGSNPRSVAIGDFNGDANSDLAVANFLSDNVSILLGSGTGSFSAATNFAVGLGPSSVAIGDFNSDGNSDLAVPNLGPDTVSILLGSGTGSFSAATNFSAGPDPVFVAIGDFNNDGKGDLATANSNFGTVSILLGTGTGSFSAATNLTVGPAPNSVVIADFNGDGNNDLALANFQSNSVAVLLGTGTGSFSAATNFTVGTGPLSIAIGDFNGDGKGDLAVANQNSNNVSILLGTGLGSFSAATNFTVGSVPESIAIGDFNGDGKSDLATANQSSNNVSILLGTGTGSFSAGTNFTVGSGPAAVAIGDFNGDGKNDLTTANFSNDSVSILLNNGAICNTQSSLTISGQITTANNNPLADVTVTLAGPITRVTATDINGNYSFPNLVPGGNYTVTVQSNYFVMAPSRFDFFNLSSSQAANFVAASVAVPQPSPPPSDNFSSTARDASKWTIGTQTASPVAFDPQVTTTQVNGQLVIAPVAQATGLHFGGYASANAFDLRNGKINVELVKPASGGADTIFAIGSDSDNFYRFMVHSVGTPTSLAPITRRPNGTQGPLDESVPLLIFQVKINGQLTSLSINYDPVLHRFMRFRNIPLANTIVFETSPNDIDYTVQHTVVLQKGVSALTAELSAGTSNPANPGTAVFDNFGLVTSTFQFSASNYAVNESDGLVTVTVTRSGSTATPAAVDFATADGTALQRTRYINTAGRLSFAAGELSKTFTVLVEDNAFAEGSQTVNLLLMNPTGSGLNSPGRALIDIADNDTSLAIGNPLDDPRFFVTQNYFDFLSRFPDQGGSDFWTGLITSCGPSDAQCISQRRITVSNAFFFELEFQQTGAYVFRVYRTAFGNNQPFPNPDANQQFPGQNVKLPSYDVFARDRAQVVGGSSLAQSQLDLANAFVQRPEFLAKYPASLDGPGFVDAMLATIMNDLGVNLSSQRPALIDLFNQSSQGGRGAVLYRLADDNVQTNPINNRALIDAEYIRSFVATQYFGYLRRDADIGGFLFWLGQVNSAPLRDLSKQRAMVCAFITSAEYQQRFSQIATRNDQECQ